MKVFILKSNERLPKDFPWNVIKCMQDGFQGKIQLEPTQKSIKERWLQWIIPDNPYNRMMVSNHYGAYEVIESDMEVAANQKVDEKVKAELTEEKQKNETLQEQFNMLKSQMDELLKDKATPANPELVDEGDSEKPEGDSKTETTDPKKPLNNNEIKIEKDALKVKLTAKGMTYPPTASLTVLQELAKEL